MDVQSAEVRNTVRTIKQIANMILVFLI